MSNLLQENEKYPNCLSQALTFSLLLFSYSWSFLDRFKKKLTKKSQFLRNLFPLKANFMKL